MKKTLLCAAAALLVGTLTATAFNRAIAAPPPPVEALMSSRAEHGLLLGIAAAGSDYLAVGGNGVILRSGDGQRWTQLRSPVDSALTNLAFADARRGWAVGHDGVILHSADGGQSWQLQNWQPELAAPLFAVLPLDAERVVAVGAFGAVKLSSDGGKHWSDLDAPAISADKYHLNGLTRLRDGRLLVVGERGLVGVSDDGSQWRRVATPYEGSFFGAVPMGEHGALVFGMRGSIYYAENPDAGQWRKIEAGTSASLFGGALLAQGAAVLVGADGVIVRVDGGNQAATLPGAPGLDHDQVLAAVRAVPGGLIVGGEKGISKIALRLD